MGQLASRVFQIISAFSLLIVLAFLSTFNLGAKSRSNRELALNATVPSRVLGQVHVIDESRSGLLSVSDKLRHGQIVAVDAGAAAELDFRRHGSKSRAFLSQGTIAKVLSASLSGTASFLELKYGHLRMASASGAIELPHAEVSFLNADCFISVTENRFEFQRHLSGFYRTFPHLENLDDVLLSSELFTQIACLKGKAKVSPRGGAPFLIVGGEVTRAAGAVYDLIPSLVGLDEIYLTSSALGLAPEQWDR